MTKNEWIAFIWLVLALTDVIAARGKKDDAGEFIRRKRDMPSGGARLL